MKKRGVYFFWFLLALVSLFSLIDLVSATCINPNNPGTPPGNDPPPPSCGENACCTGSPCYVGTGDYSFSLTDLQLPTRGFPIEVTRVYDSINVVDGIMGKGWTTNLDMQLYHATYLYSAPSGYQKEAAIMMPQGRLYRFIEQTDGINYTSPQGSRHKLVKNGDGSYTLTLPLTSSRYEFNSSGQLITMIDEYGNSLVLNYDGNGVIFHNPTSNLRYKFSE
ncbi:DUF6531 domain-containing protein [bacterium]|nr:DUF6531 domain-containing protein [bacterium]